MLEGAGTPVALELPQAATSITKGLIGVDSSGFVGAAGNAPDLHTLVGVIDETSDNSAGAAGDKTIAVVISRNVLWVAVTTGTPTQAMMHDVVSLDASSVVDEDDPISAILKLAVSNSLNLLARQTRKYCVTSLAVCSPMPNS